MSEQSEIFSSVPGGDSPEKRSGHRPLAVRMRPRSLDEVMGQDHLVGKDCLLPALIRSDNFGSIFLYGPPGCGKTTLAEVIAHETGSRFIRLNAVLSNVAELRDILRYARNRPEERTILFIDEIHRFNKAQQDLLLPDVEEGNIRLIGATTHSPGHYINAPLLSRSHLFRLESVGVDAVVAILRNALTDMERGLGARGVTADRGRLVDIAKLSDGDLRRALNTLETIALAVPMGSAIEPDDLKRYASERQIRYDANDDEHYDTISAFIKSVRGCDPDAALYWLAKMVAGGEDPRFIARRLIILASEDVGLADSRGLQVATAAFQAVECVGMPECQYALAHATVFLALAPKSNAAGVAYFAAKDYLQKNPLQPVPPMLRDAHSKTAKSMGNGAGYIYSHECPENISGQEYMANPQTFYRPKNSGAETALGERLAYWKSLKAKIGKEK